MGRSRERHGGHAARVLSDGVDSVPVLAATDVVGPIVSRVSFRVVRIRSDHRDSAGAGCVVG